MVLSSSYPFFHASRYRHAALIPNPQGKFLCLTRLSYRLLTSCWYFIMCSIVCNLVLLTRALLWDRIWLLTTASMHFFLNVGTMSYVGGTASDPKARWKRENRVECFGVILYTQSIIGSYSTHILLASVRHLSNVPKRVLLVASAYPIAWGW